ncbi:MAG TPA: pseudouridine synthase [Verrucomicrobiae bacterium]|nr:pseudouridine synthase [Verrucomicrobiae bacterium]
MRRKATANATTTATTPRSPSGGGPAPEGIRLQKVLAAAGVASRREAERLIQSGRVEVNDRVVTALGTRVDPRNDRIRVDGSAVGRAEHAVTLLLHKPKGVLCTVSDPRGRPTVLDLVRGVRERLFPVGRLDWNSEGLLLLTNDGELAQRLTHPSNHVAKTYRVKVKGVVGRPVLEQVRHGLFLDGRRTLPAPVRRISSQSNTWLEILLFEGRKNQIRRVFERLGHPVLKLRRTAIGPLTDRDLKPGEWRPLTTAEVRALKEGR